MGCGWPEVQLGLNGLLGTLSPTQKKKNRDKEEKKERIGDDIGRADSFPGLTKNMLVPRKIEKAVIERFKFKLI